MIEASQLGTIRKIDEESLRGLEVLYLELSHERGFPDAACVDTSKEIVQQLGFNYAEGHFRLDSPRQGSNLLKPTHAWCEDADGVIIDLTASQFNSGLEVPISKGVQIIKPNTPFYYRYLPLVPRVKRQSSI